MGSNRKKDCSVCGSEISEALSPHTDRCKDCDTLRPRERIEFSIKTRQTKYLALIAQELRYIRNRLPKPAEGEKADGQEDDS